jgi:hypothetical protein
MMSRLPALGLVCCLTACQMGSHLQFIPTRPKVAKADYARTPDQIELFTAAAPSRAYRELGLIEGEGVGDPPQLVLAKMRRYAAELGCDALVVTGSNDRVVTTVRGFSDTLKGYRATCIAYGAQPDSVSPGAAVVGASPGDGTTAVRTPHSESVLLSSPPPRFDTEGSRPWYKAPALWLGVVGLVASGITFGWIASRAGQPPMTLPPTPSWALGGR